MKTDAARNNGLALIGLAALTIYILACTSFSPDDKKVLYPAFDPQTGVPGVAVCDRKTSQSRMLFAPMMHDGTNVSGALVRPQWLGNGQRILVTWSGDDDAALNLAIIPETGESAVRLFRLASIKDATSSLVFPVAVAGQSAFVTSSDAILKLNLANGAIVRHNLPTNEPGFYLYPGLDEESLFYFAEGQNHQRAFGRFNPENFEKTPILTFTNELSDGSFFAHDEQGRRIAFLENSAQGQDLVVLEAGKPEVRKPLWTGEKFKYGSAVFLNRKNVLLASYMREGTNTSSFGLQEIPLYGQVRDTVLIRDAPITEDTAALYFQAGVSHDGRTAAVCSTYLACASDEFKPDDCALFLVDLNDARRKVTKIPIARPAHKPRIEAIK